MSDDLPASENIPICKSDTEVEVGISKNDTPELCDKTAVEPSTEAVEEAVNTDLKYNEVPKTIEVTNDIKDPVVLQESAAQIETIFKSNDESSEIAQTKNLLDKPEEISSLPQKSETENNKNSSLENPPESTNATDEYSDHVSYNEDGDAIYTDPQSSFKYKWCTESNKWLPIQQGKPTENPYENEHYKWCSESNQWVLKNSSNISTEQSQTETEFYKWDATKSQWIAKETPSSIERVYGTDEDGQRIYTDKDGAVFFWEEKQKAWFPKIDDDFMARYQMNYGFIDNTTPLVDETPKIETLEQKSSDTVTPSVGLKRKLPPEPPKWFDVNPEQNTKVYVSNLPQDITLEEFSEIMSKCGMIMRDPKTQKQKLKLYTEADGQIKGDGLCDYIKVESVDLALKILDGYDIRDHKIKVQQAKFQMRGEYNPALKPKRQKKDKEKLQKIKEKLFDWRPEKMRGERSKNEKIVIIKNLFAPELFDKEVHLIIDYQKDLREECSKCGSVRKVVIYDRHPEGVAQVNMSSPEEADIVIKMMDGRFFGKRKLAAEHWDGKTKYKVAESETEVKKRLTNWDTFLESDDIKESEEIRDKKDSENSTNV